MAIAATPMARRMPTGLSIGGQISTGFKKYFIKEAMTNSINANKGGKIGMSPSIVQENMRASNDVFMVLIQLMPPIDGQD